MLSAIMPPALLEFSDNANRADNTDTGSSWRKDFSNLVIATNRFQHHTVASFTARNGAWQTWQGGSYNGGRLLTDNFAVEAQLIAPTGTQVSGSDAALTCIGGVMPDSISGGMVCCYFVVTPNLGCTINTYNNTSIASPGNASAQSGQTQRSSTATNIANTDLIRFERKMYSATQSVFTAYRNGSSFISWNDSGAVCGVGGTRRRWFCVTEGVTPVVTNLYSVAIDSIRAYDLKS